MEISKILSASLQKMQLFDNNATLFSNNVPDDFETFGIGLDSSDSDGDVSINDTLSEDKETGDSEQGDIPKTYEESIKLQSGEKTDFSIKIGDKIYYYKDAGARAMAPLAEDPSADAVGVAVEADNWGTKTEFYKVIDGSIYYFESFFDLIKTKIMTVDAAKNLAVGAIKNNTQNAEDIKNNADAVNMLEGNKTEFYIDSDGIRYYYDSYFKMSTAAFSNDFSQNSVGYAQTIDEWGSITDYSIEHDGYTYYFANENDMKSAQDIIDNKGGGLLSKPEFDKYVVGRRL